MHFAERQNSIQASRPHSASHISADGATYIGVESSDIEQHHTLRGDVLSMRMDSTRKSSHHCQIWCSDGRWYIKDTKSTLGTFLNYVRLSKPGIESSAYLLRDGDILQLGQSGSCGRNESGMKRFLLPSGTTAYFKAIRRSLSRQATKKTKTTTKEVPR
jgi:pSer/pThr/pTyr-binding forkhead associated (FHA) protein